jgi:DNA-binding IclR family transcriptional regulator
LAVLEAVVDSGQALSLSEVARKLALPVPTVHRLFAQLEERQLLKRALGSRRILPGPRLVDLGMRIVAAAVRADPVHQVLETLAAEIGENCQIGQVRGRDVVYLDSAHAVRPATLRFEPGHHAPIHCSSTGKLFLAELEPRDLDLWIADLSLTRATPSTITSAARLRSVLAEVRRRGWAATNEEFVPGVVGCAVPLRRAPKGELVAALGISVPAARVPFQDLERFIPHLKRTAERIARILRET